MAAHAALQCIPKGVEPDIVGIARQHNVDPDEVDTMYRFGLKAWRELSKHVPNARAEERLEGDGICGTADIFHNDSETMVVWDWKTGRIKGDYMAQVKGYGAAGVDQYGMPESGMVTVIVVWLRFQEYEVLNLTQDDIERFHHDIKRAELQIGKEYAPGNACAFCRRQLECKAREDFLRSSAAAISTVSTDAALSRETIGHLYHKSKHLKQALGMYDKALKLALQQGDLEDENGHTITTVAQKRDKLDPQASWPILTEAGLDSDDLAGCVSLSKTKALKIVNDRAAKGYKGKAKAEVLERLRQAGAVQENHYEMVKVVK
jgi:hypothetical protein